jgi:hypothetical protein
MGWEIDPALSPTQQFVTTEVESPGTTSRRQVSIHSLGDHYETEEIMKLDLVKVVRYLFPILVIGLLILLAPSSQTQAATAVPTLIEEFDGTTLDGTKWVKRHGNPSLANGKLTLAAGINTAAEIQSLRKFSYGIVQMSITSSNWKPQSDQRTDSSFGFEIWQGANGQCHYSVVLKANGHLGLLRPQPDANGNCSGDPEFQSHLPIPNWDALRAGKTLRMTLTWAPKSVTLHITSGSANQGGAYYFGVAEPTNSLKIRLNALNPDKAETYKIDYVRVVGIPWR